MSNIIDDINRSMNIDDIEQLMSNDDDNERSHSCSIDSESRILVQTSMKRTIDIQHVSLSMETTLPKDHDEQQPQRSNSSILQMKTSNVPGPVGRLPILVSYMM
jgi:hypothetical protein